MLRKFVEKNSGKSGNWCISDKRTIQLKISVISGGKSSGAEIPDKKFPKYSAYLARLSTLPEIPKNTIPFVIGNYLERVHS